MADRSAIEWTDASWNPIRARNLKTGKVGWHCEHSTMGCEFCYAEGMNKRLGTGLPFKPGHRKDIEIFLDEEMLLAPLRWKKPRMIFVCSMTDLFADFVTDEWRDKMFAVMALCPQHTFQVLTKRAERMREYFLKRRFLDVHPLEDRGDAISAAMKLQDYSEEGLPLPNVWLGVSAERQQEADERIPLLLQTPAAVRFLSLEPLLGPVDIGTIVRKCLFAGKLYPDGKTHPIGWVIVGGESGPNARPMHPDWARSLRDQCQAAGVSFFFKQWGEWAPVYAGCPPEPAEQTWHVIYKIDGTPNMVRPGKKRAGRLLDGVEHNGFPERAA